MKAERKRTLRGRVIAQHEDIGKPNWGLRETIGICLLVDAELRAEGLNRTPAFRKAIESNDMSYIKTWVMGCHFSWLNPRDGS